jgi:hypothetical protein
MQFLGLIELRKTTAEDKLAMLAISYRNKANTTEMVRSIVEQQKINYTVFSVDRSDVSAPYNQISGIPSSFLSTLKAK